VKKQKKDSFSREQLFSPREQMTALNNAVVITASPETGGISEARKRKLREYAQALVEASYEHVEEGVLTAQELVHVLAAGGLYVYIRFVGGGDKLPASLTSKEIYERHS